MVMGTVRAELARAISQNDFAHVVLYREDVSSLIDEQRALLALGGRRTLVLAGALIDNCFLAGLNLSGAELDLSRASLVRTNLSQTNLHGVRLAGADLRGALLAGADLTGADLGSPSKGQPGADLRGASMDGETNLKGCRVSNADGAAILAGVRWGEADLAGIEWWTVRVLGDELRLRQSPRRLVTTEDLAEVDRAYRELAMKMRGEGFPDAATRFDNRGDIFWRRLICRRGGSQQRTRAVFSWILNVLCGNGYRPQNIFGFYLATLVTFAVIYGFETHREATVDPKGPQALDFAASLTLSVLSFHGRGFGSDAYGLQSIVTKTTAVEAVIGLFIEIIFITTLARRLFNA